MIKKILCFVISAIFLFSFVACGNTQSVETATEADSSKAVNQTEKSEDTKSIVVYFSATGTTKKVAEEISKQTKSDIIEIQPKVAYTSDDLSYNNNNCRANIEQNDSTARPEIGNDLSSVSQYDIVYLGYPVWWGTNPRIIQTFIESYDLSGKNIYLFCTSGSSGIEKSVTDLKSMYSDLNILGSHRFASASESDVQEWLDSVS